MRITASKLRPLGKPNTQRPKQIRAVKRQVEAAVSHIPRIGASNGASMGKFWRLEILGFERENGLLFANCVCDCGRKTRARFSAVKRGDIKSCGCLKRERAKSLGQRNRQHGQTSNGRRGRTYRSWESMKSRCLNRNDPEFYNYGGRGIAVCETWGSFVNFLNDMGERPIGTTIDRIDNNAGYTPKNCRWAVVKIQQRNKRTNRKILLHGVPSLLIEACETHSKPYRLMYDRIFRQKWTPERAFL